MQEENFLQKNPLPVTCTAVAYVCHITDIFIITESSQKCDYPHPIALQPVGGGECRIVNKSSEGLVT